MTMNNAFKDLFDPIRAEQELKDRTWAFLAQKMERGSGAGRKKRRYPVYAAACACMLLILFGDAGFTLRPQRKSVSTLTPLSNWASTGLTGSSL